MSLDHVYYLIWRRRLERLITFSLPVKPAILILTGLTGVVTYFGLATALGMFSYFDELMRTTIAFQLGTLVVILPLALAAILLPKMSGNLNETAFAMPISQSLWAKVLIKYHYLALLPIMFGAVCAYIVVVYTKMKLDIDTLYLLVPFMLLIGGAGIFFSYYVGQYLLVVRKVSLRRQLTVLPLFVFGGVSFVLIKYAKITLDEGSILLPSTTVILWVICAGLLAFCGSFARKLLTDLNDTVPIYRLSVRRRSSKNARQFLSIKSSNVFIVLLISLIRNIETWLVYAVLLFASTAAVVFAKRLDNPSFNELLLSALPMILVTACITVMNTVRNGLGTQRNSIYALPISATKVILSFVVLSWIFMSATLIAGISSAQWFLHSQIGYEEIIRLFLLASLASLLASVTSVLFFETKKDVTKGLMSSMVSFMVASPLFMLDGWLESKTLLSYGVIAFISISLMTAMIYILEQTLTAREYA